MALAAVAIEKKTFTYFAIVLLGLAGIAAFFNLGQLEDPEFTVKTAVVTTSYPGASPQEVELEVTDRIELAIQEISALDYVESFSRTGFSLIKVEIRPEFWSDRLPQIWDELRRKIRDIEETLPPGAGRPEVSDDFGDVFGLLLAVTGDGFSYGELDQYVKKLQKELALVKGVARVDRWGVQDKAIYLNASETQLALLGLTDKDLEGTVRQQNMVVDAGKVDAQTRRFRIAPTGEFQSPQDIADLNIRPSMLATMQNRTVDTTRPRSDELIRIRDIGTIRSGYLQPPRWLMRYDGRPALGIAITNVSGVNVVEMGRAVDARLQEMMSELPVGIELHRVHWQSDTVAESVNGFFINLIQAIIIVLVVLTVAMGWRMGVIIGTALVLTILGTFVFMAVFGIDLQRMSLGALVIALGMMVDNSIVVADGIAVRLEKGMDRIQAAIEAAAQPAWPLLGATLVAVMAFYPIYASVESAGEYCRTLFTVVAISLLVSWVLSMTLTPLQCIDMLPAPKGDSQGVDPYSGFMYQRFQQILAWAIRVRWLTLGSMGGLLVIAILGFAYVERLFFPDSSMPKFMIDYWATEGTRIQQVSTDLKRLEAKLLKDDRVEGVGTFIGQGPPRFYLPVDPESPYESYGQLIVNVHNFRDIDALMIELEPWLATNFPEALVPMQKYGVGPSNTWKFEVRFSGPAVADPGILRAIADQGLAILKADPLAGDAQADWRQRVQRIVPEYNQERARWSGVMREDIAVTTKRAFDGRTIGLYREGDELIPIVLRHVEEERQNVGGIDLLQVQPASSTQTLPLSQVTDGIRPVWEDPMIWRRDRRRTITVQSNPVLGTTLPTLRASVLDEFEAIELPPEHTMEWGGEHEDSTDAQAALIPGIIPAVAVIALVIVALFNAYRPPLIIVLTIPFAVIGITAGLLLTNTPFGFLALLGAMSLAGMMIKNAIVLLDQIRLDIAAGKEPYQAVMDSAVSRLRPVLLAAATTVLGVIPLLQDVFWIGMAVTIMAGLSFGTILTMVIVPVLYVTLYRLPTPGQPITAGVQTPAS